MSHLGRFPFDIPGLANCRRIWLCSSTACFSPRLFSSPSPLLPLSRGYSYRECLISSPPRLWARGRVTAGMAICPISLCCVPSIVNPVARENGLCIDLLALHTYSLICRYLHFLVWRQVLCVVRFLGHLSSSQCLLHHHEELISIAVAHSFHSNVPGSKTHWSARVHHVGGIAFYRCMRARMTIGSNSFCCVHQL